VRCGHPGFVPDEYLNGLRMETTISAADLRVLGTWERVEGGYRVLDWEAVEVCLDKVREDKGEDARAVIWEREREAYIRSQLTPAMVVALPCALCRTASARIELLAPGHFPAGWEQWPDTVRDAIVRRRGPGRPVVSGIQGRRRQERLRRPHRHQRGRADHPGIPVSPVLRPGAHGRVLR
jgi:hypothetical protein